MEEQTCKRLFIGIPMDDASQQAADLCLQDIRYQRDDIRWLPAHNRHLTLAFLGEISNSDLQTLQQHFTDAYQDQVPFLFTLNQLTRFPDVQGKIIAAVNSPSDALIALYQQTRLLLQQCAIPFEEREYRPHITLGRIKHARQVDESFEQALALSLQVDRVNLYESVSTNEGRLYQVLQQVRFLL